MVKMLESKEDGQARRPLWRADIWARSEGMSKWLYDRTVFWGEGLKSTKVMK